MKIRKAILLGAGKGTRLRPLTNSVPKCLVPIHGKTLLDIWLDRLSDLGVEQVLLNTHHHAEQVSSHISRRGGTPAVKLFYERELLGSAGTVLANREFVRAEDSFWVVYADNLTRCDLTRIEAVHRLHSQVATIGVYETDQPHRCGIVEADQEGLVLSFEEKPTHPRSGLANAGIYLFRPTILDHFPDRAQMDFGFDVLPRLTGRMFAVQIREYILDIGTLQNYYRAIEEWPSGEFRR